MARNPTYQYTVSYVDRSGERATFSIPAAAGALDLDTIPADLATFLNTAVDSVCDGERVNLSAVVSKKLSNDDHADVGNREEKWLCTYSDTITLALYQMELPCRKATVTPPVNTDKVDLTVAPWVVFKTDFEAAVVSPDGNAVTLESVTLIGRNN